MSAGDHLIVKKRDFGPAVRGSHHGIDIGDGTVVHFSGESETAARVHRTCMRVF